MLRIVDDYVSTVASIAKGDVAPGAAKFEQGLANSLPVAIGFLANQVGLGDLSTKLTEIIGAIRLTVDKALDWLMDKAINVGHSILSGIKTSAAKILGFFGIRQTFQTEDGESHSIYYEQRREYPTLMVASTPRAIEDFLNFYESYNEIAESSRKGKLIKTIRDFIKSTIEPEWKKLTEAKRNGDDSTQNSIQQWLLEKNEVLSKKLRTLLSNDLEIGQIVDSYLLEGLTGTFRSMPKPKNDILTPDHQPQASIIIWAANEPYFGEKSKMAYRARGSHADGGYAINLHEIRHQAGRTYGNKGAGTKANFIKRATKQLEKTSNEKEKRAIVVDLMKQELEKDAKVMKKIVSKSNKDPIWSDIHHIDLEKKEKDKLIQTIRQNIKKGEYQLESQDLESLKQ